MASGLLRLFLALIVFAHHLSRLGLGRACVYIFFALSGYWVARMWQEKYSRCENPWRTFVLARFLRIWPLFVLMNLLAMAVMHLIGGHTVSACDSGGMADCGNATLANTLILGHALLDAPYLPPAWSLDIELQFYLIAPFVILALTGPHGMAVFVLMGLVALVWQGHFPEALPKYLPYFAFGILAATGKLVISRRLAWFSAGSVAAMLVLMSCTTAGRSMLLTGAHPGGLARYNDLMNLVVGLCAAPAAVYLACRERKGPGAALGDLAFILYVVHWPAVLIVGHYWGELPAMQRLPYVAAAVLATFGFALLVRQYVDQPLERWRRRHFDGRRPSATRPAAAEQAGKLQV